MKHMNNDAQKIYLGSIGALIALIAVLNYYAYQFHWYWKFWWFDNIMHTLGGIFVGSFSLWWYFFRKGVPARIPQKSFVFMLSLAAISVIGVGWELFEFSLDKFITLSKHDPVDTASDLFFDATGSIIAVFIFFLVYNRGKVKIQNEKVKITIQN